jgi:hypothetical protein
MTPHAVVLATRVLACGFVLAPTLLDSAGLSSDDAGQARLRRWFARLLLGHFDD